MLRIASSDEDEVIKCPSVRIRLKFSAKALCGMLIDPTPNMESQTVVKGPLISLPCPRKPYLLENIMASITSQVKY